MGQNLGRAVNSVFQGAREKQLGELAVERAKLENDLLRSQISNINSQPGDAPRPIQEGLQDAETPVGYAPGFHGLLKLGVDPETGKVVRVWNDDLGDNEVMQALTAFGVTLPDLISGRIGEPTARKLRTYIQKRVKNKTHMTRGEYHAKQAKRVWDNHPWTKRRTNKQFTSY
jgi:hypothetical protein